MKQIGSVITGSALPGSEVSSATGTEPGATGFGVVLTAVERGMERLLSEAPAEIDKALEDGLTQLSGSRPGRKIREFIGKDGQFDFEDRGWSVATFPDQLAKDRAMQMMAIASRPAPPDVLAKEITRVCLVSVGSKLGEQDREAYLAAMVAELSEYPADVALEGLRALRKTTKWLPTAAEVHEFCGWRAAKRERLRKAVREAPYAKAEQRQVGDV